MQDRTAAIAVRNDTILTAVDPDPRKQKGFPTRADGISDNLAGMPPRRKKPVEKKRPKKEPLARKPAARTAPVRVKKSSTKAKKTAPKRKKSATRAPTKAAAIFPEERITLPGIGVAAPPIVQPTPADLDPVLRDHGLTPERSSVRRDRCDACGKPIESGDWLLHHTPATCPLCARRAGNPAALSTRQSITHDGRAECRAWWWGQLPR
jgi:hypothetical protein